MKVTLEIGKVIPQREIPKNKFFVTTTQMSGDADAYDDTTSEFDNVSDATEYVALCLAIQDVQSHGGGMDTSDVIEKLKEDHPKIYDDSLNMFVDAEEESEREDYFSDTISEMCGYDVTCDSQWLSSISDIDVVFYDESGTKHAVKIIN